MIKRIIAVSTAAVLAATGSVLLAAGAALPASALCIPADAYTEVIDHPAEGAPSITIANPDYKPGTEGTAAIWANFSPNDKKGPFDGPPAYPTDARGTWQDHGQLPPGQAGPDGVYQKGSGNGDWFYRQAAIPGTDAVGEPTTEVPNPDYRAAWQEEIEHEAVVCEAPPTATTLPATIAPTEAPTEHKWYVCKYVGTPGVDERLQTGQNPIFVDEHSIEVSPVEIGATFSDQHGRSIVFDGPYDKKLDPEPSVSVCPAPQGPPPTACVAAGPWYSEDGAVTTLSPEGIVFTSTGVKPGVDYRRTVTGGNLQGWTPFSFVATGSDELFFRLTIKIPGVTNYKSLSFPGYTTIDQNSVAYQTGKSIAAMAIDWPNATITSFGWSMNSAAPAGTTATLVSFTGDCGMGNFVPVKPQPVPRQTVVETPVLCTETQVTITTTNFETPFVWSSETQMFVPGVEVQVGESVITQRDATNEDYNQSECGIIPGEILAVCVGNIPYLSYGVDAPHAGALTITFVNPDGEDYVIENADRSGEILWPGASVDPANWPGWVLNSDGTYSETDGNFAWTRNGVTVRFSINPSYETVVQYPAATALCANPPVPEPEPIVTEWIDGVFGCGDTTVEQTRSVTGFTFDQETNTWVEGETVTESRSRVLTADEVTICPTPSPTATPNPEPPVLAETGQDGSIVVVIALALLVLGAGLAGIATLRSRGGGRS